MRVVCARAEEYGRGEGRDGYGTAVARALAAPAVAVEWCLPLVRPGGVCVLYAVDVDESLGAVAVELGSGPPSRIPVPGTERRSLLVMRKIQPTPGRFPRRGGLAKKRPLA